MVRSKAEQIIDNWLYHKGIVHAYERRVPIEEEVYCDFIKALEALIYINNNECGNMLDDLLFELKITLFTHTLPHHFENLDTDCLGLISQINWLKRKFSRKHLTKRPFPL